MCRHTINVAIVQSVSTCTPQEAVMNNGGTKAFVYTLQLEHRCWYVGSTKKPPVRLRQHRNGIGSEWTRLHAPTGGFSDLQCHKDEQEARLQEDVQVKRVMLKHGIDFVRGGSYSSVHLSSAERQTLSKELFHASNRCLRCGSQGHWAKDCIAIAVNKEKDEEERLKKNNNNSKVKKGVKGSVISVVDANRHKRRRYGNEAATACSRCGRNSHTVAHCYAKTHFDGTPLQEERDRGGGRGDKEDASSGNGNIIKSGFFSAQGTALKSGTRRAFSSLTSKLDGLLSPFAYMQQFVYGS